MNEKGIVYMADPPATAIPGPRVEDTYTFWMKPSIIH